MNRGTLKTKSRRPVRPVAGARRRRLSVETLESRQLLTAAFGTGGFVDNVAPRNIGAVQAFQVVEQEASTARGQNDSPQTAEFLPLGTGPGQQNTIDVRGHLPPREQTTFGGNQAEDVDFYRVELRAGDILDIAGTGAVGRIDVLFGNGQHWFGTAQNMGEIAGYPRTSPLQTLGNAVAAQVVPEDGTYFIRLAGGGPGTAGVGGTTAYTLGLRAYRPVLESAPLGTQQTIFLDFDGGIFATSEIPGLAALDDELPGTIQIPSLVESLVDLGFDDLPILVTPQNEAIYNRLVDNILERVERHFFELGTAGNGFYNESGVPGEYGIQILNSRDHADPGLGDPFVTRVLVGGSAADLFDADGLFGIAQGIDVGNFSPGGLVLTLLDAIGEDALEIPVSPASSRLEVAAQGIALTISHELAHNFGIWHTDRAGNIPSLVDAGVDIVDDYELGPDGIFGTADDVPMSFPFADRFEPTEGLFGFQRVAAGLAFSLPTGTQAAGTISGRVFNDVNRDGQRQAATEAGLGGITVFLDRNGNGVLDPGETSTTTAADGTFSLPAAAGENRIAVVAPTNFEITTPPSRTVTGPASNVNFGLFRPDAQVTGTVFDDVNNNGFFDPGEPGVSDITVYIDVTGNGRIDIGDPRVKSGDDGNFRLDFSGLSPGEYQVRAVAAAGLQPTAPDGGVHTVQWDGLNPPVGLDFGFRSVRDFGDLPDSYRTLLASGGPSHGIIDGLSLGATVLPSSDGAPSPQADADPGDDGVRLVTPLAPGSTATFEVTVTNTTGQPAFLQAFFDFNQNGTFLRPDGRVEPGEQVLVNRQLAAGTQLVDIPIPEGVQPGNLFTRWRLSQTPDLGVGGFASTGEVEDHRFTVQPQAEVANDDFLTVSRNTFSNRLDVLANDFETAENQLTITAVDRISLGTRGQVVIGDGGRAVFYTPPLGFIGQDQFTYTVTPEVGPSATATVTVNVTFQSDEPIAIDDTFEVAQGSNNVALNVLDNDIPSTAGGMTIIAVTPGTQGGLTSLAGGNQSIRYTPRAGFAGTEQFTYTIQDAAGNIDSATATVNLLPGARADDVVSFDIDFLDTVNQQPINNIQAGNEFLARVSVEDLRPEMEQTGIFSAFLDLLYTDQLVAVRPDALNPLEFDIEFGPLFAAGASGQQSGDASIPGIIDEVGSVVVNPQVDPPPGVSDPDLDELQQQDRNTLLTIRFQAVSPGIAVFAANPADDPVSETTVFDRFTALGINELRLGISELVITPPDELFTSAIDDAFPDGLDSLGNPIRGGQPAQLDVLANDLLGPTDEISEFFLVTTPSVGSATISNDRIVYTPDSGAVNRFDSFKYGIVTADGVRSTAEVTLFVGDPIEAQNTAPVGAKPFDVDISLQVVDGNGNPIGSVAPGSRFGVQVIVQDLRSPLQADPLGVFAAFTDILYDAELIQPSTQMVGMPDFFFDFDVRFDAPFGSGQFGEVGAFGTAQRPGIIDEFGSFLANTNPNNVPPNPALTGDPVAMATLFFEATGTGPLRLVTSPADALPLRDTLLFQPPEPVPVPRIRYNVTTVTIGGGSGEGESPHNALLPADVNGDGKITPQDALLVLNHVGRQFRGADGEASGGTVAGAHHFFDVNGDGKVTPLDALLVLNHLGNAQRGGAPLNLDDVAALNPSTSSVVPVQNRAALNVILASRLAGQSDSGAEGEAAAGATMPAADGGELTGLFTPSTGGGSADDEDEALLGLLADDVAPLWK